MDTLFYCFNYVPQDICDIEVLQSQLEERLRKCIPVSFDSLTHLLLIVLSVSSPHLKRSIIDIENAIFSKKWEKSSSDLICDELERFHTFCQLQFEQNELRGKHKQIIGMMANIAKTIKDRAAHWLKPNHDDYCRKFKILLPFTFPLRLVSKRQIELNNGKVVANCGLWRRLLEDVFEHSLYIEIELLQRNVDLFRSIFDDEDDRVRRLLHFCIGKLGGHQRSLELDADDVDSESKYFPPCMANLHQILRKTHRLSYDSRYQYSLFLKDAGLSLDENITFWETEYTKPHCGSSCQHHWEDKRNRYQYQLKHMYGVAGCNREKLSPGCLKFTNDVSTRMDGGCPFKHLSSSDLRDALPNNLKNAADSILYWKDRDQPQRSCARRGFAMSTLQPNLFVKMGHNGGGVRSYSGSETDVSTSTENLSHEERYVIRHTARQEPQGQEHLPPPGGTPSNRSSLDVSTCSYNTLIIHAEPEGEGKRMSHHFDRSITDIPDDYLSQSQVLKHLAKEAKSNAPGDEPRHRGFRRDKLQMSKSQPDLRLIGNGGRARFRVVREDDDQIDVLRQENSRLRLELESYVQKLSKTEKLEQEFTKVHRAQEELVQSSERRGRLEREARTRLQTDCRRLQELNRALRDQVEVLSTQLLSSRVPTGDAVRRELNNRDLLITQLIASNKELSAAKERQEIELAAQRATLQEQRTHIDILDTALTNAQGNVVRLEEECRKKQMYVELVTQLKQALVAQQQASDRREQTEQMLRLQLERELRAERAKSANSDNAQVYGSSISGSCSSNTPVGESASELKRKLRERDEKIMILEKENAKWEQRYIEESALRQAAIEAASLPKDAKIAALEKTSQETERLIAEARSEKMRHMDEQHAAQKRVADLESRVKDLESRLAERDAMIKVLQKHTYEKDVSSSYPGIGFSDLSRQDLGPSTSVFSTVSSALTSSTGFTSFSGCSDSSGKLFHSSSYHPATSVSDSTGKLGYHGGDSTSKLSFGGDSSSKLSFSGDSFHGADSAAKMGNYGSFRGQYGSGQSFDDTKKSLDDQLKELDSQLDSQLLSKRGLCCFPGFSNSSTAPRKGKISQPLLAGVVGLGGLVRAEPPARPEEMMLLEKQGRSSQRQRAGSLPPSSLPRPRRPRKLGEYGRLSDSEAARKTSTDEETTGSVGYGSRDRNLVDYGHLADNESVGKKHDEPPSRPPTTPSPYSYSRLKTPPIDPCKLEYGRKPSTGDEIPPRPPSTPCKLEFVNYPRLKTPPIDSPFVRKSSKEGSPGVPHPPAFVPYNRFKTPPVDVQSTSDLSRKTPPKGFTKKSFIPPPRKLGEYGRLATRSSSDSSPGTPRDSGEPRASSLTRDSPTPNYRIRF